jgi:DNA-binding NarL/FixJ family response regulator
MRRLLLVEDNPLVAKALEMLVGELVRVEVAPTLRKGKQALRSTRWTALVIDISLPDGTGLDALAYAREQGYRGPVLVYSAYHDPDDINRAYALGAKYLVKPGNGDDLRNFVIESIRRGRSMPVALWAKRYKLTHAETSILRAAANGWSRDQIAARRKTSLKTTKTQIHKMLSKTGDASLIAAAARLLREARGRPLER